MPLQVSEASITAPFAFSPGDLVIRHNLRVYSGLGEGNIARFLSLASHAEDPGYLAIYYQYRITELK